jgi:hypothetical protein
MTDYAKAILPEAFPINFITAPSSETLLKTHLFHPIEETQSQSQSNHANLLTRYSNLDCPDTTQIDIAFSIYAQLLMLLAKSKKACI